MIGMAFMLDHQRETDNNLWKNYWP